MTALSKPFFALDLIIFLSVFCVHRGMVLVFKNQEAILEGHPMPNGYYAPYLSDSDQPYWPYAFGESPYVKPAAGTIPKGSIVYLQGPPPKLGTHQSGHLDGVGRIIVKIGGFKPAPALVTNS